MTEIRQRYGAGETIRKSLGRLGFNTKGQPIEVTPLSGARPVTLAKRVAARRNEGAAWWRLELETGKAEAELKALLLDHGYGELADGRVIKGAHAEGDTDEAQAAA